MWESVHKISVFQAKLTAINVLHFNSSNHFVTIGVLLFFKWRLSHVGIKHFRRAVFFLFITLVLYLTVLLQSTYCMPMVLNSTLLKLMRVWEVSVFKRCSCSAYACHYYFFFLCWLVLIFYFFIKHSWGYGAWALNICNYTCWDMHSPLHLMTCATFG